jgi:hypothetical protein
MLASLIEASSPCAAAGVRSSGTAPSTATVKARARRRNEICRLAFCMGFRARRGEFERVPNLRYRVILEPEDEGGYNVVIPAFPTVIRAETLSQNAL